MQSVHTSTSALCSGKLCRLVGVPFRSYHDIVFIATLDEGQYPDYATQEGLKTLVVFACYIIVQGALNSLAYEPTTDEQLVQGMEAHGISPEEALQRYSMSAIPFDLRISNTHSRGRILEVLFHVFRNIVVKDEHGVSRNAETFLFYRTLAWFIRALKDYHSRSLEIVEETDAEVGFPASAKEFNLVLDQATPIHGNDKLQKALEDLEDESLPFDNLFFDWPHLTIELKHYVCQLGESFPKALN